MVVDGGDQDASLIARALRKQRRAEVVRHAANGDEALGLLTSGPRLIFMESHLRGMPAMELLDRIRRHPMAAHVPVVFLSDDVRPQSVVQALHGGANAYVAKALEYDQMTADLANTLTFWLDTHQSPYLI